MSLVQVINFATTKRGNIHGKAFFFPWQSFRRNSDDPLIAWQERREYVAIATALPRMKKSQSKYLRRYDIAISTERRRYIHEKMSLYPRQDVAISTTRRRKVPRQAVDIATLPVVFKKKIWS